jgi:phosphotransferase system enzyme I (PtsI)
MEGRFVIIRTMDIGGDKQADYLGIGREDNPFLGYRAIRICLDQQELFLTQLRAILRASVFGKVGIMFPMISSLSEYRAAKKLVFQAKEELAKDGCVLNQPISIGAMVEVPSCALIADKLIKEADFLSIGSNDLTQYTVAADRMNPKVAHLYTPFDPGTIRLIKSCIEAVREYPEKFVGMCGEMAGNPIASILLIGLGLQEFSVSPSRVNGIKWLISHIDATYARRIAMEVLEMDDAAEIETFLLRSYPDEVLRNLEFI